VQGFKLPPAPHHQALKDCTVLIPARLGSSRLPNKPLADLGGEPMIVRVAQWVASAGPKTLAVATDSERIAETVRAAGFQALMTRGDHVSGTDRLAEAVQMLGLDDDEIVVNVQGDEPFIPLDLVAAVAALLAQREDCAMASAAHEIHDTEDFQNPNVVKVVLDARNTALYFSRSLIPYDRDHLRQAQAHRPLRHLGLYSYRVGFLKTYPKLTIAPIEQLEALEQLRALWHGYRIAIHVSALAPPSGVDTAEDLERARHHYQQNFGHN
jgi:3-deoxy-manno-octulosonate cytidylyltransferase (CMP-KDO synthetase)